MARARTVLIERRGNLLSLQLTKQRYALLSAELTYEHRQLLVGAEAKRRRTHIDVTAVRCFEVLRDPDGVLPPRAVLSAGWLPRVRRALRKAGYRVVVRDNTPRQLRARHQRVFQPDWSQVEGVQFRYRQREALEKLVAAEHGRIWCPTGWGKSFVIAQQAAVLPRARLAVTTHSVAVCEQLYDNMRQWVPSVGLWTGGTRINRDARVLVISGKSLHHAGERDGVIVDEVHEFSTQDYLYKLAYHFPYARLWGFSANQIGDRMDGADFELEGAFGQQLVSITYQEAVEAGCVVPIQVIWDDVIMDHDPCADAEGRVARQRWGLWRNEYRHQVIARAAREYDRDTQVLIMVNTVEHALFLKRHLPEFTLCYSPEGLSQEEREAFNDWAQLKRELPEMTRERVRQMQHDYGRGVFKKAIATTVWKRGVDFPQLGVLCRADAGSSKINDTQLPGRTARTADGKAFGIVRDFRDQFNRRFREDGYTRSGHYKEHGWEQVKNNNGKLRQLGLF